MTAVARGGELALLEFSSTGERIDRSLRERFPGHAREAGDPLGLARRLRAYFEHKDFAAFDDLALVSIGPAFHCKVWQLLREIPPGATRSYGHLAKQLGSPGASRAVGYANSQNPIAIVVPCHRVIGANGALTGYAGGLEKKHWLLVHEGAILV